MIRYIWYKVCKKMQGKAIKNTILAKSAKIEAGSVSINSSLGKYSYCGYDCVIVNAQIGNFCSIADNVKIGSAQHPLNWLSTSPAFYKGRDSIPKDLAELEFCTDSPTIHIGNDVWIGANALIKGGVTIGNGAVIGMGSVVTKDVKPYAIVAGNPARLLRYRFEEETILQLEKSKWWDKNKDELKRIASYADKPQYIFEEILK